MCLMLVVIGSLSVYGSRNPPEELNGLTCYSFLTALTVVAFYLAAYYFYKGCAGRENSGHRQTTSREREVVDWPRPYLSSELPDYSDLSSLDSSSSLDSQLPKYEELKEIDDGGESHVSRRNSSLTPVPTIDMTLHL